MGVHNWSGLSAIEYSIRRKSMEEAEETEERLEKEFEKYCKKNNIKMEDVE